MTFLALQDAAGPAFFDVLAPADGIDQVGAWMVALFTLAVYSFLYKDNPFYKFAEHVFVGAGTAFFTLQYYEEGIREPLVEYIHSASNLDAGQMVSLGGYEVAPMIAIGLRAVAALFGLMLLVRLVKSDSWAPRWPLAIMVGVYAALKMTGETQAKLVLPVQGLMRPLTNPNAAAWSSDWSRIQDTAIFHTVGTTVMVLGTVFALSHFLFTYKRTPLLGGVSRVGVMVLMVTFGSMFGFTVLGRIALLIERVETLGKTTGNGYQMAGADGGMLAALTSPPLLVGGLIVLVLVAAKLSGKDDDDGEPARG